MKDLASLYLEHGFCAVAQEDISQYHRDECTDLLEWAAEYKKWDLFDHVLPYADKSRTNGFALRKCIENQYVPGVALLLPHNDLRTPYLLSHFDPFGGAVDQKNTALLRALLTPVCIGCHSYECVHPKEIVSGDITRHNYMVLYNAAMSKQPEMFKVMLDKCNQHDVRTLWDVEWRLKTPIAQLFDQTVEQLALEQHQRICEQLPYVNHTIKRKL